MMILLHFDPFIHFHSHNHIYHTARASSGEVQIRPDINRNCVILFGQSGFHDNNMYHQYHIYIFHPDLSAHFNLFISTSSHSVFVIPLSFLLFPLQNFYKFFLIFTFCISSFSSFMPFHYLHFSSFICMKLQTFVRSYYG